MLHLIFYFRTDLGCKKNYMLSFSLADKDDVDTIYIDDRARDTATHPVGVMSEQRKDVWYNISQYLYFNHTVGVSNFPPYS